MNIDFTYKKIKSNLFQVMLKYYSYLGIHVISFLFNQIKTKNMINLPLTPA